MIKKKSLILLTLMFSVGIIFILNAQWWIMAKYYRYIFDLQHPQKSVITIGEIDKVFEELEVIRYRDLNENYKNRTHSDRQPFSSFLSNKKYYVIDRGDFYKKLVGDFRVVDFVAKDNYYRKSICRKSNKYYWLLDKRLIYKVLELQNELEKSGFSRNGFSITNGHRHPRYNKKVGGASRSCHIKGQAVDIHIKDVNGNGRYEPKDKEIILDILNKKVIKDSGGIGRYPGTRAVHFDVRGYRARWDSY